MSVRPQGNRPIPCAVAAPAAIEVRDLVKHFPLKGGFLAGSRVVVKAVDGISFAVRPGETLGIVGESGCGKSTTARLLMHLITADRGDMRLSGDSVHGEGGIGTTALRREVQMVFQDSYASLNPRLPIQDTIAFGPIVHGLPKAEARARARELLASVGLEPRQFASRYPHELSGGQRQRVNIARALALHPSVVVLDEAVSALDKSIEAQVLNLLVDLKARMDLTYIFISHDLNVVQYISDRVLVMYLGKVVEVGAVEAIYGNPRHPYTQALLDSRPSMDPLLRILEPPITGDPPSPVDPPPGCRFHTRCAYAEAVCRDSEPALLARHQHDQPEQFVACHMQDSGGRHSLAGQGRGSAPTRRGPDSGANRVAADRDGSSPAVEVRDLHVCFRTADATVHAVNGIDFSVHAGELLCIIGESGSGKSVTLRALQRLLPEKRTQITGSITIDGEDVLRMSRRQLTAMRGRRVAMVFQEPMTALDPVYTIGQQIAETVIRHEGCSRSAAMRRALELLEIVQIPSAKRRLAAYPHELSGGLRQRAMIALALSCRPTLLLADEPTTALDATVQIQVLLLLRQLQREMGMAVIFVTHDIGVAGEIADRLAIMYAGRFVETGPTADVIGKPLHPYAEGLLGSTVHGNMRGSRLSAIPGSPPNLERLPAGCSFAPRCSHADERCRSEMPQVVEFNASRHARCFRVPARR